MDLFGSSLWLPPEPRQKYVSVKHPLTCDIAIVGGSFAGLTAAYCLAKAGYQVVILEARLVGEAGSRAAGVVCSSLERDYLDYVSAYNTEIAQRLWNFSVEGVDFTKKLVETLDPQNRSQLNSSGSFYASYDEDETYMKEEAASRRAAGFTAHYVEDKRNPLYEDDAHLGIFTPQDATINPYQFCQTLADAAVAAGATIYENSKVQRVDKQNSSCYVNNTSIKYDKILLAGQNVPGAFGYTRRQLDILTFCLATEPLSSRQIDALGLNSRYAFWDADQPFFYGRLTPDNRLLLGGDDLWRPMSWLGLQNVKLDRLERRAKERIPLLEDVAIDYRWGGSLTVMPDAMPTLGVKNSIFIGGNAAGISQAVMVGKILAGLVVDCKENITGLLDYKRRIDLIPKMYSSRELFHMIMSLAGIF